MANDLITCLIDEICLEGLDGITLEDIWLRLKERPGFDLILDDSSKEFLWTLIKQLDDVEFYELPEPRKPLIIFDRYKYIDPELGTVLDPDETPEDIYPFHQIDDTKNGVMGSCSTYYTRCKIKEDVASMSYTDIISRYGRKFVVVGNQLARKVALMGDETDPGVELSLMHFCLLERIGRSRYHGEITQGKISLQAVGEDPKSLFYHRKFLTCNNFITKQVHHLKTGAQNCSGSLLHLPRFYVERKPKALYLTEKVIEMLKSRPNCIAEYDEIRQELRLSTSLKKLFKTFDFQKFVRTDMRIPYRALYPDAKQSEWKLKANDREKSIRVIQLIDPDMNVQDLWNKDDEFEEAEDANTGESGNIKQVLDRPFLTQAYYVVETAGSQGISQIELASIMGISKLQSRTVCRNLLRTGLITTFMNDIGRQRVSRFMAKIFERQSEMNVQFNREKERMLALTSEDQNSLNSKTVPKMVNIRKRKSKTFDVSSQSKRQKTIIVDQRTIEDDSTPNTDGNIQIPVARSSEVSASNLIIPKSLESDVQTPCAQLPSSFSNASSHMASFDNSQTVQEITCYSANNSSLVNSTEQNTLQEETVPSKKLDILPDNTEATQNSVSGNTLSLTSTSSPLCVAQTFPAETSVSFLSSELTPIKPEQQPVVTTKTVSDNGIVTEITESTAVRQVPSVFAEDLKSYFAHQIKDTSCITYRLLRRANLIIECIKTQKVIEDLTKLMKLISEEEDREGYNARIDKKSLMRLPSKLSNDGFLKVMKVVLKGEDKEKVMHFVCEPSVTVDHSVIQSALEQARVKFLITPKEKVSKPQAKPPLKTETNKENSDDMCKECPTVNQSVSELNAINVATKQQKLIYDKRIGRKYGFSPKFIRMKALHQFLFYLVAGYEGEVDVDQAKAISDFKDQGIILTEEDELNIPRIFVPKLGWKMFIPPLPKHAGWPEGWALMCDILLRLPLSIFVQVFNVSYIVPDMEDYLKHPVRRHYLVKHLPENMRYCLISKRKYIFSVHEVMQRLCFVGLVRFGPQRLKEKDQVFVYLNRRTHLLDTTTSKPGYHQVSDNIIYEEHKYYFGDMADVDKYWYDLWNICLHTNLGGRLCVLGKDIVLEVLHNKPAMLKSLEPVTPQDIEAVDVGDVPGDKRGAGGLDSALFSHLKRNWNWSYTSKYALNESGAMPQTTEVKKEKTVDPPKEIKKKTEVFDSYVGNVKKANRLQSSISRKSTMDVAAAPALKPVQAPKSKAKAKKFTRRVIQSKNKKQQRPYYDAADQAALLLMSKLRVDWSHKEDNLLLLCKVASMYLCPVPRQQLVSFQLIRDKLHRTFPESHNKTSRACQRRITYMMKNMSTASSVVLFLEEIRQDPEINKKFKISVSELRKTCENSEEVEKIVAEKFQGLIEVLEKRFDKLANMKASMVIPDTPEQFWKKYEIIHPSKTLKKRGCFQDVKCISDIQKAVIQSVIHSSLCCVQDKTSWAYQLFKVYQQFPDNLLRSAMTKIREDQIVSLKKNYMHLALRKGNFLPLSCSPFQLSISFRHILQTNYQYSIFHRSFTMSLSLENWHTSNDLEALSKERGLQLMVTDGGSTAALVELFCKEVIEFDLEIPDQIITLNPKVSEVDESYARIIERYKEILRSFKLGTENFSSSALFKNYRSSTGANSDESDEEDKGDPDYSPPEDPSICNSTSLARTASRIALHMMREELEDKMVENSQHAHDFFVVNSCTVYCKINKLPVDKTNEEVKDYIKIVYPLKKEEIKSTLDDLSSKICIHDGKIDEEDIRTSFINTGKSESDWAKMSKIISYLASKKELGARLKQLEVVCQRYFRELPFSEIVSFLMQNGVVIRNGVTEVRYIHWKFVKPWLVNTRRLRRLNREKIKPNMAKGLRVDGDKKEVVIDAEKERKIKKKGQKLHRLKKRKSESTTQQEKQKQMLRKIKSQTGKTKSTVIKRNRYRFSHKARSRLRAKLKAHTQSSPSDVNSISEQATVVQENTVDTSSSCCYQKNEPMTDSAAQNIPVPKVFSGNDCSQQADETESEKPDTDSMDNCSLQKADNVNDLKDNQESIEAQISDDVLKLTSPKIAEDHKSLTVSETAGTAASSFPSSSNIDGFTSSSSKHHVPESTIIAKKGKASKTSNKRSKEVKQENVKGQRPRRKRRDEIPRKDHTSDVNSNSEQAAVVQEKTVDTSSSCCNQKNEPMTDDAAQNIPVSKLFSGNDCSQQADETKSGKHDTDSVDNCSLQKADNVNDLKDTQESIEAQISDDVLKLTSPKIAEEHKSLTVSETAGTTVTSFPSSSTVDVLTSSNSKHHVPESTIMTEKGKTSKTSNKKSKEVKQENVEVQRPRRRRRDEIPRKDKIEMDKTAKVMELRAAAKELENSEQIQISLRPWIRINGTLNRRILDRLLGAILGHCMFKPGSSIESIGERFSPAIQPYHVRELVEILWKIGCVKLLIIRKSWTATLFSTPSNITILPADGSESSADIVVDPQPDAITRLGQFIGNKTYTKDFISC